MATERDQNQGNQGQGQSQSQGKQASRRRGALSNEDDSNELEGRTEDGMDVTATFEDDEGLSAAADEDIETGEDEADQSGTRGQRGQRGGAGNFANDPERASDAGRKGGRN